MAKVDNTEDHGRFAMKQAINAMGVNSGTEFAIAFAKGAVQGCIQELIAMTGEREAFEYIMKQGESIIRAPDAAGKIWTPPAKG